MIELDSKLLDQFKGYVVRKDVVRSVKGGANVPVFVLEYLLANSCSTDDEKKIQEGQVLGRTVKSCYPRCQYIGRDYQSA